MQSKRRLTLIFFMSLCLGVVLSHSTAHALPFVDDKSKDIGARADEYSAIVDTAIKALVSGDGAKFRALLSPGTIRREQRGPAAIDTIINDRYIPFFKGFKRFSSTVNTLATRDIDGHKGLALCRSFYVDAPVEKDGNGTKEEERFFVIYVLDEDGTLTIGNLLLNTKMSDLVRGR